jgi:pimeloyl-ACP methyl ester carboxylesterase
MLSFFSMVPLGAHQYGYYIPPTCRSLDIHVMRCLFADTVPAGLLESQSCGARPKLFARDMVAGMEWAKAEEMRKRGSNTVSIVLVGHSMGGGLVQYTLSKELVTVTGLILCGPVPGSGM